MISSNMCNTNTYVCIADYRKLIFASRTFMGTFMISNAPTTSPSTTDARDARCVQGTVVKGEVGLNAINQSRLGPDVKWHRYTVCVG